MTATRVTTYSEPSMDVVYHEREIDEEWLVERIIIRTSDWFEYRLAGQSFYPSFHLEWSSTDIDLFLGPSPGAARWYCTADPPYAKRKFSIHDILDTCEWVPSPADVEGSPDAEDVQQPESLTCEQCQKPFSPRPGETLMGAVANRLYQHLMEAH